MTVPGFVGDILTGVHCVALQRKNNWPFMAQRGFLWDTYVRAAWIGYATLGHPAQFVKGVYYE
jgi:hypothetical protein